MFVIEVFRSVKKQVDDDFPIMIKLGCRDYVETGDGLSIEEGVQVAQTLEQEGVCLIEVSNCTQDMYFKKKNLLGITSEEKEACFLSDARAVRQATAVPLSIVGGMRSPAVMEDIIDSGDSDMISICRPLIREPDLIKRWKAGDRRLADCISCGKCFNVDDQDKMRIYCSQLQGRP